MEIGNRVERQVRDREHAHPQQQSGDARLGFLPAQAAHRPEHVDRDSCRRRSGVIVGSRGPGEEHGSGTEPAAVPIPNPAALQQQQSAEPRGLDLALRPRAKAIRDRVAARRQKTDGKQPAQFDRDGKRAAQDNRNRQQQQQDRGSGFGVVDRQPHSPEQTDPHHMHRRMGDHRQIEKPVVRVRRKSQVAVVHQHVGRVEESGFIHRAVPVRTVCPDQNQQHDKTGKHKYRRGGLCFHRFVRGLRRRVSPPGNLNYSLSPGRPGPRRRLSGATSGTQRACSSMPGGNDRRRYARRTAPGPKLSRVCRAD